MLALSWDDLKMILDRS